MELCDRVARLGDCCVCGCTFAADRSRFSGCSRGDESEVLRVEAFLRRIDDCEGDLVSVLGVVLVVEASSAAGQAASMA